MSDKTATQIIQESLGQAIASLAEAQRNLKVAYRYATESDNRVCKRLLETANPYINRAQSEIKRAMP